MPVKIVESSDEFAELKNSNYLVVDFFADWCGPCRRIAPDFMKLSQIYADINFCKVDIDNNKDIATEYKIECMPTFLFFKNGELKHTVVGANLQSIKDTITNLLE